ncbi:MAG: hypothetical protein ACLQVY_07355 [Limisphaerales bacterium]
MATPAGFGASQAGLALYWLLMVVSFLLVAGIFNYTEFNSTKDWNGFPYRMFALPVPTWQLVALPMFLGVVAVELVYAAWIKLVWLHEQVPLPGWFAVVLGAYMVFYQAALWGLAGFRIVRLLVLSLGGMSSVAVMCLPSFGKINHSPWLSERRLIVLIVGMAVVVFVVAWGTVARQRCGGGFRQNWGKILLQSIGDAMPRRSKDFASPAAAQFWYEWRRSGWVLPVCVAFVLMCIFAPISWFNRTDPRSTNDMLGRVLGTPIVLAFIIGKAFIKPEFWSASLSFPAFFGVRPLATSEFTICKMKAAALSAIITCLLVTGFIVLWLQFWADTTQLHVPMVFSRVLHPHSWQVSVVLYFIAFVVLIWRCMVGGLWVGLSGNRFHYLGSLCLQVILPALLLAACGIWSDTIDLQIQHHPEVVKFVAVSGIGWTLAILVILKLWLAVFSWSKITSCRSWQYLLIWSSITLCFVALGILSAPWADTYRLEHLFVLAALLLMPFGQLGLALSSPAKNRHR